MPSNLDFLSGYAEPVGSLLDADEAAAINDRIEDEGDETWTEVDSWYVHSVAVAVLTDGARHVVFRRIDRPAPGARERYEDQIAQYRTALDEMGHEPPEPMPWELETETAQLDGFTGYADENAALQDGLRLTLGAVITHEDDVVHEWCGWRDDVVILTRSQWGGGPSNEVLRIHSTDGRITSHSAEDILRAYSSYAEAVQKLIDDLDYEAFKDVAHLHGVQRIVEAWLARSAANAMLERARYVLRIAADGAAQFTEADKRPGLVGTLAAGLHTDRPNLYRVIPQMKKTTAPSRKQKN